MGITFIITLLIGLLVLTRVAYRYAERKGNERLRLSSILAYQWAMVGVLGIASYKVINDPTTPVPAQALILIMALVVAGAFLYGSVRAIQQMLDPEEKVF